MTAPDIIPDTADVVIIGAGAAGAAFAWRLSGNGLSIVCLEQGDWIQSSESPSQHDNWELALQTKFNPDPNIRKAPADYPVDTEYSAIEPANYNAIGGSTIRWGAHFPRMHPSDFKVATLDGVGADWPISYGDLEQYYDLNDQMMGVCGLAGDPANPSRRHRPFPPLPLCSGTMRLQTAFDLLGWHSDGLKQVGRNLMLHPTAIVTGVFKQPLKSYQGPFACALFSQEFYETDRSRGFLRGFQLQALRSQGPLGSALGGYMEKIPWGHDHHRAFANEFAHTISIAVTTEDLPEPANFIDLAVDQTDNRGIVIPRMHYRVGQNTQKMLRFGIARAKEVLQAADAHEIKVNPLSRQAGFHFMGTARMGNNTDQSVVSAEGRCHAIGNLLVVDSSVFPSSGAVNPTPTLQAFALRCADALLDKISPAPRKRVLDHVA